jgi:drug/metabolite transporter (DMT)-like permease
MRVRDLGDLLVLAALWGASFLFMRIAAPAFGPLALAEVRVAIAAVFLGVWLAARGELHALRAQPARLAVLGLLGSALPFALLAYAMLHLSAGYAAFLNATVPLWTALIAWLWLGDSIRPRQWLGLGIGLAGVAILVSGRPGAAETAGAGPALAIVAAVLATGAYGLAANYTRKHLTTTAPLVLAAGSQIGAALVLLAPAAATWPVTAPPPLAWASAIALGIACTGFAFLLYFRLLTRIGAVRASAVTFLIPLFGTLWGALLLGEQPSPQMLIGGGVILAGTGLALGLRGKRR